MRILLKALLRLPILLIFLSAFMLAAAGCTTGQEEGELKAADFGVPEQTESPTVDPAAANPSITEPDEEGTFIDHHGNRVVSELYQTYEQDGLLVEFTMENFLGVGGRGGQESSELLAGERAVVKFRVTDATTGEPLTGLRPAAWLDLPLEIRGFSGKPLTCEEQVQGYLGGTLMARPTVDLNSFFILALNDDPSISVIDPTVDVAGMTQLFALIQLTGPGQDWAMSDDQQQLFVTLPDNNQVAVAEMDGFDVAMHLDGGIRPMRIAIQPDGGYVWVGNDANDDSSGVTVIDPASLAMVAFITTGAGHHELAFSADSGRVFVSNGDDGTLSVIDSVNLQEIAEVDAGRAPVAVAYSEAASAVYVADGATGEILVYDGESYERLAQIESEPGLVALSFAPGGRWAFGANPVQGTITVIDANSNEVTHVAQVGGGPDQVAFSDSAAYIRAHDAALVNIIQLADLDPNKELELASVPVGTLPPGQFPAQPLANAVSAASRQGAVVIANPVDDQVYFYPEGSTSTSGSFQGHTLRPRAVTVVDRSLREDAPGVYSGRLRVPASGDYIVALMLNDPLLIQCFQFFAKPNPALDEAEQPVPELTFLNDEGVTAGQPFNLRFSLTDPETGEGLADLEDILILATQTAGNWNTRQLATSVGEGIYEVKLTVPNAGLYSLFFAVPSLGLSPSQLPMLNLQATAE